MKAGFARIDITPSIGCSLGGDYNMIFSDGILSKLYANAVAFSDTETTVCTVSLDILEILQWQMDEIRTYVSERTGLPMEAIYLACTHTHTGPDVGGYLFETDKNYYAILMQKICDAVILAVEDLKDAKAYIARTQTEGLTAIRRYRMSDGSIKMNPTASPEVIGPVGTPDHTLQLVRLVREGASDIAIVNFQTHACLGLGKKICHDWPGFCRSTLEGALFDEADGKGVNAVVFVGAQGDTNQLISIDREERKKLMGLEHCKHMGRKLAGYVLSIYGKATPVSSDKVFCSQKSVFVAPKKAKTEEQLAEARRIYDIFQKHKGYSAAKEFIGDNALARTAEAVKFVRFADAPDTIELKITCVGFSDVAFVGFPGEPFTEIGRSTKENSPFAMTIPTCNTNGSEGYFSMRADIEGGVGYEAMSARFEAGVAEKLIDGAIELTKELKNSL